VTSVEYAYARIAARHGRRPRPADWHRIETPRTLAAVLEAARGSAFERWLAGLDSGATHDIEAFMRARWRAHVDEVARWMPDIWVPAIEWCATLPDVPVVVYLARGGKPLPWFDVDPWYRQADLRSPPRNWPLAPLARAPDAADAIGDAWRAEWKRRLPRADAGPLAELERVVVNHLSTFRASMPNGGTALRNALAARLDALFRRAIATPAAAFVFIALTLLDLERLRGELVRRAAMPRQPLAA
jgi:hypothetical protein